MFNILFQIREIVYHNNPVIVLDKRMLSILELHKKTMQEIRHFYCGNIKNGTKPRTSKTSVIFVDFITDHRYSSHGFKLIYQEVEGILSSTAMATSVYQYFDRLLSKLAITACVTIKLIHSVTCNMFPAVWTLKK